MTGHGMGVKLDHKPRGTDNCFLPGTGKKVSEKSHYLKSQEGI